MCLRVISDIVNAMADTPQERYERIGTTTLVLLTLPKLGIFGIFLIILGALTFGQIFFPDAVPLPGILPWGFLVGAIILAISIFFGWLEYIHYAIAIDERGIKVSRGMITEKEIALPYRRIKTVTTERTIADQLFGVSGVTISILGEEDMDPTTKDTEIVLPALRKDLASHIQDEIMKRAQVEQINIERRA